MNAADRDAKNKLMRCTVSVECLSEHTSTTVKEQTSRSADQSVSASKSGYSMRVRQTPKKVTHRTSGCKRPVVDYSQYDTSTDPPSPPKWHRKVDLKRKPSKTHIAAEKYKTKPLGGPRLVRRKDTHSPPASTPNPVMTTDGTKPSTSGTITVAATDEETQTAIDALLSLGTDLPVPNTDFDENAALVPLAPQPHEPTNALQPSIIGTAVKIEDKGTLPKSAQSDAKKKKTFVTVEYKLSGSMSIQLESFPVRNVVQFLTANVK